MNIQDNVSLAQYSTMGLGGTAAHVAVVTNRMELLEALTWAQANALSARMIGTGSNIIWRDEGFAGLLIINKIMRFEVFNEDDFNTYVTVGAGENWDSVVARSVEAGLTGIEALSLIPGSAGATPIQNVGAYGQDISQTLVTIEAFDTQARDYVTIAGSDCGFGYRTSRFKGVDQGRFYITAITLHLTKDSPKPPFYAALQTYLDEREIKEYSPAVIREAVVAIRQSKLPDPNIVKNTGSFFANPVIPRSQLVQLQTDLDIEIPNWPIPDGNVKIPAAWLMEQSGFKNFHDAETGMGTWPAQCLVLINEQAKSTEDLLTFKQKVIDTVKAKFGITLEQEPELLP